VASIQEHRAARAAGSREAANQEWLQERRLIMVCEEIMQRKSELCDDFSLLPLYSENFRVYDTLVYNQLQVMIITK